MAKKKVTDDPWEIPVFLRRKRVKVYSEVKVSGPIAIIPEMSSTTEFSNLTMVSMFVPEGGQRRFLVVRQGNKIAELLHLPDLEHLKMDIADIRKQVESGSANWAPISTGLAAYLRRKAGDMDRLGSRYSRSLVNEALAALGEDPLPAPLVVAEGDGTPEDGTLGLVKTKVKVPKGPGVIDTLIDLLNAGGGTIDELFAGLIAKFPERGEGMRETIKTQVTRLPRTGRLNVVKQGEKYVVAAK